jgi:predicted dehydrogenase
VGIVGAGSVADLHAKGYLEHPDVDIVAVCDPDEDLAIQRSLDWGARRYYTNFDEFVRDDSVDAVAILTPNYLHAEQATAALKAGKHVSMERPIATTIPGADRVLKVARASGKILQVFEPSLFYKPLLDARNLIDAGEIGKPTALRISATIGRSQKGLWNWEKGGRDTWRFDPQKAGGTPMLYEIGYQAFAVSLFLIGSVERIEVWQSRTPVAEQLKLAAPTVSVWKHFQQNCFGSLSYTYAPDRRMRTEHHPLEMRITIAGTRGEIDVLRNSEPTLLESPVELRRDARKVYYGQKMSAFEDSFVRAVRNFVGACKGDEEPLLRGNEAKQLLILTLAYHESAKRGRAVTLQQG